MGLLDKISRGRVTGPVRLVVYGPAGVGKSSFAAGAPSPLFFDFEGRTNHLDVARVKPQSWDEVLAFMRELYNAPGEIRTVVFDTVDHMEMLIHKHVCKTNSWENIEDPGFGKGYVPALLEWARFLGACEALQSKGLNTVLLAHSQLSTVKNPSGDDYNVFALKLKGGAKTNASDLVREKVDLVGFAHFEDFARKENAKDKLSKAKAITTGARVLTFAHHPAFETKKGVPMADETKLSWDAFEAAIKDAS
jgi:AAA domain-containing protein